MEVTSGTEVTLPTPTKTGETFLTYALGNERHPLTFTYDYAEDITLTAVFTEDLTSGGTVVNHRGTTTPVKTAEYYTRAATEFRGIWVTQLVGDIAKFTSRTQAEQVLTELLDNLVAWKFNAVVYHIRMMNDALYPTSLAPLSGYVSNLDFGTWDYLEWFIGECHDRGIEFHAWLNPYRINNSSSANATTIANAYSAYPDNPASSAANILISEDSSGNVSGAILDPSKPAVRDYVVDVCLEVAQNYQIDAINFDDYFWRPIQGDTTTSAFKRQQIDLMIEQLAGALATFNADYNRNVELGIAPTGIYRNGNGVVTYGPDGTANTTGSNTAGQEHYASYLFCDTKKWVDNEWLDYICPQTYWAITHRRAGLGDVLSWWDKVVAKKNVKLYGAHGIYMTDASWGSNPEEAADRILYMSSLANVQGSCFYNYRVFKTAATDDTDFRHPGVAKIFSDYWTETVSAPH